MGTGGPYAKGEDAPHDGRVLVRGYRVVGAPERALGLGAAAGAAALDDDSLLLGRHF